MAKTEIEWATDVWNPTKGCDRVSPGCDHCYAMTMAKRLKGMGQPAYQLDGDPKTSGPGFLADEWPDALAWPLTVKKPMRVFVNSMADLFHDNISDEYIARVFAVMALAPQHTFQVLTKRHARMRSLLSSDAFWYTVSEREPGMTFESGSAWSWDGQPLPNVWLGVSVENQHWADIRIPALLNTPAAVRFLSCEPLLGHLDLSRFLPSQFEAPSQRSIDWVIVGGESGPGARPMHPDWARTIRDQCVAAGVPFLFKQWGAWSPDLSLNWSEGNGRRLHYLRQHFAGAVMDRVGKKAAGRELDGRTWDEYPAGAR